MFCQIDYMVPRSSGVKLSLGDIRVSFQSSHAVLSLVHVTINNCANCWTAASRYTTVSDIIRSQPLTKDPKGLIDGVMRLMPLNAWWTMETQSLLT